MKQKTNFPIPSSDGFEDEKGVCKLIYGLDHEYETIMGTKVGEKDESPSDYEEVTVFLMKCDWNSPWSHTFEGTCVVSGAKITLILVAKAR